MISARAAAGAVSETQSEPSVRPTRDLDLRLVHSREPAENWMYVFSLENKSRDYDGSTISLTGLRSRQPWGPTSTLFVVFILLAFFFLRLLLAFAVVPRGGGGSGNVRLVACAAGYAAGSMLSRCWWAAAGSWRHASSRRSRWLLGSFFAAAGSAERADGGHPSHRRPRQQRHGRRSLRGVTPDCVGRVGACAREARGRRRSAAYQRSTGRR